MWYSSTMWYSDRYSRKNKRKTWVVHDAKENDPDWLVKQCYLLLLAAVWEGDVGIDNLWKKGKSSGCHNYANFGRYVPMNWFRAWQSAAPYMFSNAHYWYEEWQTLDWHVFLPCLQLYNDKQRLLIATFLMMIDESMSGWHPKTPKTGGPRKPVPLGTQFHNSIECFTGCLVYQDIVMNNESQQAKPFFFVGEDTIRKEQVMTHLQMFQCLHIVQKYSGRLLVLEFYQVDGLVVMPGSAQL